MFGRTILARIYITCVNNIVDISLYSRSGSSVTINSTIGYSSSLRFLSSVSFSY
jgi:hypothetical protein